jgi:hypothetical protein
MRTFTFTSIILLIVLLLSQPNQVNAQADGHKNTVLINVTNPLIFGSKALIFGYERVFYKHHSLRINVGKMSLPNFSLGTNSDSIKLQNNSKDKGLHLSGEYRYYFPHENKYDAPHGIYIGAYYSYNGFSRSNNWLLNTSTIDGEVNTKIDLKVHTVGLQLGYQFILWKRATIDFVLLGPGIGFYDLSASIDSKLDADEQTEFFDRLNSFLSDRIPGYNRVINEGEFKKQGSVKVTSIGLRYNVSVGFRF